MGGYCRRNDEQLPYNSEPRTDLCILGAVVWAACAWSGIGCSNGTLQNRAPSDLQKGGLIVSPEVFDGGIITQRQISFPVLVQNCTNTSIRIIRIEKSCSCTVAGLEVPAQIDPHGSLSIPISVRFPTTKRGRIFEKVTFVTDELHDEHYTTFIRATLDAEPGLRFIPDVLDFTDIVNGDDASRTVKVTHAGAFSLQIISMKPSNPCIKVLPQGVLANGYLDCQVTLENSLPEGDIREEIEFETNYGTASLRVIGTKRKSVFCPQTQFMLEHDKLPAVRRILLRHAPSVDIGDACVSSSLGTVSLDRIVRISKGTILEVTILCRPPQTRQSGSLTVTSDAIPEPISIDFSVSAKGSPTSD